ncbi:MAG TPA: HWE histidine kinase domain-containing protein [Xanthobacteraceae bacterium]|nr:HWE histidine kinase domain-containing protein [Xanthobacteraceae bacterium]
MSPSNPKLPLFEDADETVAAIHQGDVDAVVVMRSLEGPRVILLHGAEEPYRVLVESMSDGALTMGPDGVILYVNDRLCEQTGYPSTHLVGSDLTSLFEGQPPALVPEVTAEAKLLRNDSNAMPVAVWSRPISIGGTTATLVRLVDLSIHRRAEQIATAERFARSVLEQSTEAVVVLSPDGHITHTSGPAARLAQRSPIGRVFSEAFPLEARNTDEPETLALARFSTDSLNTMLATKPFHGVEVKLRGDDKSTFLLSAGPLVDENKTNVGSIVTLTDISERKRAEEQQTTLVAELNHRVKNILAIVQSVAAQTLRSSGSLENFAGAFAGRLKALAIAHDILTETRWIGIGLSELLAAVLAPYRAPGGTRISISGPPILLPARAVVPLSMVLNEMTTNAAKYGALSTPSGTVEITWQMTGDGEKSVDLVWVERGGPRVKAAAPTGFGTKLIDHVIRHDLDGNTRIEFDPAGVRWTIAFPVSGLAGDRGAAAAALAIA